LESYEQFSARHPRIKWGSGLSGGLLAIIGLSSLPGDLENWSAAFQGIGSELGRWILVAVGIGVMVAVLVARRVPPARDSSDKHAYLKTEEARNERIAAKALAGRREKHLALALKIVEDELGIASHEARVLIELGTRDPVEAALARTIFPKWKGQTSNFIEVVLGQAARAKFDGHPDDGAEQARQCLLEMAADLSADKIRLSGPDLAHAVETRGINEVATITQRSEAVHQESVEQGLANQLDSLLRKGIDLLAELSVPVEPKITDGVLRVDGEEAPDEWWEKADAFQQEIRSLLTARNPALLTVFAEGFDGHFQKRQAKQEERKQNPVPDGRSTTEKVLDMATFERSGPAGIVEAGLDGLAAARLKLNPDSI
jgi:hypothetical protein